MTREELKGLEQLNEFAFKADEAEKMLEIFGNMKGEEAVMDSFDLSNTDIMVHVMPMTNIFREDVRQQPFAREDLLKGAPEHTDDSWQVPRLVK